MEGIESLPIDLIANIFSNLPAKYVGKFRCVSKLWASTLSQSCFTDLFLTMSSSRPRLLFGLWPGPSDYEWCCVSSPQPHNPDENTSIVVDSRIGLGLGTAPISGLIFCPRGPYAKKLGPRIGNPTTGQYVDLPILNKYLKSREFLGYDPRGKQYKILSMNEDLEAKVVGNILTFPCEKNERWRSIQCPTRHRPLYSRICINGILYYVGSKKDAKSLAVINDEKRKTKWKNVLVCFDVRSEEFKFIDEPEAHAFGSKNRSVSLSNFNGQLVSICTRSLGKGTDKLELGVWVLEDDKKPKWSKHVYRLNLPFDSYVSVGGMIGTGEIVLSPYFTSDPFYVFYFNPKQNSLKKVKIQGIEAYKCHTVTIYLNHVENVSFIA